MGPYYREPAKSKGPLPLHLVAPLLRSFKNDQFVDDEGDVVYYRPAEEAGVAAAP